MRPSSGRRVRGRLGRDPYPGPSPRSSSVDGAARGANRPGTARRASSQETLDRRAELRRRLRDRHATTAWPSRRSRGRPAARPASRRSPSATTIVSVATATSRGVAEHFRAGQNLPDAARSRQNRPRRSERRSPAPGDRGSTRSTVASRSHAVGRCTGGWSRPGVAPGPIPGPGGSGGGPESTRWTSSPARAPAAAVSRQWFDQRRPDVTRVSAPSAMAAPTRNSRLRSLLPPNASGSRSSRLIQSSTCVLASAAERRGGLVEAATGRRATWKRGQMPRDPASISSTRWHRSRLV